MTQSDLYNNLRKETQKAVECGLPLIQTLGALESIKLVIFLSSVEASKSENARSLCGDGASTRPEGQKVSG